MDSNQRAFEVRNGQTLLEPKQTLFLSLEDQVVKAEILQAFHLASSNYLFTSAQYDNGRFSVMFLDSEIASDIFRPFGRPVYGFGHPNSDAQKTLFKFFCFICISTNTLK